MEIASALSIIQFIISEEPAVELALRKIFATPQPTPADWENEKQAAKATYRELVPDTKLPPETP